MTISLTEIDLRLRGRVREFDYPFVKLPLVSNAPNIVGFVCDGAGAPGLQSAYKPLPQTP